MFSDCEINGRDRERVSAHGVSSTDRRELIAIDRMAPRGRPRLRVQAVDQLSIVAFEDAPMLFEEDVVRDLGDQLHGLVEHGHTRMLLNFGGVRYMSCAMLGKVARLHLRIERARGRLGLCGFDPILKDMLRICGLDRVLETYGDEDEALDAGKVARGRRRKD